MGAGQLSGEDLFRKRLREGEGNRVTQNRRQHGEDINRQTDIIW